MRARIGLILVTVSRLHSSPMSMFGRFLPRRLGYGSAFSPTPRNRPSVKYGAQAVALVTAFTAIQAGAAITVTVNTLNDENDPTDNLVSLREAITTANGTTGAVIQFSVNGTIHLDSGLGHLPTITSSMTITATPGQITVDPLPSPTPTPGATPSTAQTNPIFQIGTGVNVTITGLKITNGLNHAIHNEGTLTLSRCVLTGNSAATQGGGVENYGSLYVTRSTISNNSALGSPHAFGGGIVNFDNAHLWVVSSTISGNVAKGADGVAGDFLQRVGFGINDNRTPDQMLTDAENYHKLIDPGYMPTSNGTAVLHSGSRSTLRDWWIKNGFSSTGSAPNEVKAAYLNDNDLGFGRDMHMRVTGTNSDGSPRVAAYVSNYSLRPPIPDQNPFSADFAQAKDRTRAGGTVNMEYAPLIDGQGDQTPVVKFYVYNGSDGTAPLVTQVDLDANGAKFVPQLCMVCHGGSAPSPFPTPATVQTLLPPNANPSYFREFDLASFRLPRPGTRVNDPSRDPNQIPPTSDEETAFRNLNLHVLYTLPTPSPSPGAIRELIRGWYGATTDTLPPVNQNLGFVPDGWKITSNPEVETLYSTVVAKSCRTCHVAQQPFLDFSKYSGFAGLRPTIQNDVLTGPGTSPTPAQKEMPHAKVTFSNFWRSGRQQVLATFSSTASPGWSRIGYDSTNVTGDPQGGVGYGGGIYDVGTFSFAASTLAFNTAIGGVGTGVGVASPINDAQGGAILKTGNLASDVTNSLIANNFTMLAGFAPSDISGVVASQGYNLFGTIPGQFVSTDLRNIVDPRIGGLTNNGGYTPTHALLSGSAAIDKGSAVIDPFTNTSIMVDQRGVTRPVDYRSVPNAPGGNGADIGASELNGPTSDFNRDGKPDYVLSNGSTHQTAVWYMNNNVFLSGAFGPNLPAGWNIIDVADFNCNGNPDYLLFNPATRQTAIWYLSGVTLVGGAFGPTLPSGWTLVAAGDFNGDCSPDYVLYNASTRQTAVWYTNNNVLVSGVFGPTLPAGWSLAGVADFDGDGKLDYLLFNASTHQTAIWYLDGVTFLGGAFGPTLPSAWTLVGAGDFNGDGNPDYVLYNASTRQTAIWYMNNNVFLGGVFGPTLPANWNLVAP